MTRFLLILLIIFTSCGFFIPRNLTDNAFYDIYDSSVRLVVNLKKDTIDRSSYEVNFNLPGKPYKLLSTTYSLDTSYPLGVQLKFWANIVMNENGTYYGDYPQKGLLHKIDSLQIHFTDGRSSLDIIPFLEGDSSLHEVKWRKYEYKNLPYTWGKIPYFDNVASWKDVINNKPDSLERIPDHDYIFWFDKQVIKTLSFRPTRLEMKLVLVDSTGTKRKQLTDFITLR